MTSLEGFHFVRKEVQRETSSEVDREIVRGGNSSPCEEETHRNIGEYVVLRYLG